MSFGSSRRGGTPPSDRPPGGKITSLRPLARFLTPYRWRMLGAGAALVVAAGTVLGLGSGLRHLVDRGFAGGSAAILDQALVILFGVVLLLASATFARFYLVTWIGERVVADLRRAVYDHVIGLGVSFFETAKTGELLSRITTDTAVVQSVIGATVSIALRNLLLLVGGIVMLLFTSPKLTGLVLLVVPLVVLPIVLIGRRVRVLSRASQDRVAEAGAAAEETINAVRTVQAFAHEDMERARFGARAEAAFGAALRYIRARAWLTALVIVIVFGAVDVVLWVGGHDVLAGRISAGELSAFVFYAVVVAGSFGAISEVAGDLQRAAGAAERLTEILAVRPEIAAPAVPKLLPDPARGAASLENVTFHYPTRPDVAALVDLTLQVAPGETVALVGPSGAGKTTVFQLLLRFYDPGAGQVRFDGVDVRDCDPKALRQRIALVPQEPVIFAASAAENIRYGRPEASDAEVRDAAAAAAALDFIEAMPQGLDTPLGERGVRLSGGQRQRIAIARAILRDPALLLLDEATSALDSESEQAVQIALERLMRGRTTLIIAHRLATVLRADRIIVLDGGRTVESGTHATLSAAGGLYARLAALQFDAERIAAEASGSGTKVERVNARSA